MYGCFLCLCVYGYLKCLCVGGASKRSCAGTDSSRFLQHLYKAFDEMGLILQTSAAKPTNKKTE